MSVGHQAAPAFGPAPPGSQRLFPSPRASAASQGPFPPVCPTWCKPTPETPAPPETITSPSTLP